MGFRFLRRKGFTKDELFQLINNNPDNLCVSLRNIEYNFGFFMKLKTRGETTRKIFVKHPVFLVMEPSKTLLIKSKYLNHMIFMLISNEL